MQLYIQHEIYDLEHDQGVLSHQANHYHEIKNKEQLIETRQQIYMQCQDVDIYFHSCSKKLTPIGIEDLVVAHNLSTQ